MIKKIISGGQTGTDRAALDFALKFNIRHGGWIPKGRIAEDGQLPDRYQLQEMPTISYMARTEQNVIDSDGTLIFSRGAPTGGTEYTRKMVLKHKKQLLHIDLKLKTSYDAAYRILSWIESYHIKILNVAGPRASKDPAIYNDVFKILDMAYKIHKVDQIRNLEKLPKTVDEAVEKLIVELPLKDKTTIANMAENDLMTLQITLGSYIGSEFGIWTGNSELLYSCKQASGDDHIDPDHAPTVIIEKLWKRLTESYKLRIVKD
jgi:hypothetical protein